MDIFAGMSDDQSALLMCFGALFSCGVIMSLSYYVGAGRRRPDAEVTVAVPERQAGDTQRKAA